MISYVFWVEFDASEIIKWAKSKGLFIMEDEAKSFNAPNAQLNSIWTFLLLFLVPLKLVLLLENLLMSLEIMKIYTGK